MLREKLIPILIYIACLLVGLFLGAILVYGARVIFGF